MINIYRIIPPHYISLEYFTKIASLLFANASVKGLSNHAYGRSLEGKGNQVYGRVLKGYGNQVYGRALKG